MNLLLAYVGSPRFRKAMRSKPGQKGFSLIELIIAVAVIAILSAAVLPQFTNQSIKAANATAKDIITNAVKECGAKMAESSKTGSGVVTTLVVQADVADSKVKGYKIYGTVPDPGTSVTNQLTNVTTTTPGTGFLCSSNFKADTNDNATLSGLHAYCYKYNTDDSYTFVEVSSGAKTACP